MILQFERQEKGPFDFLCYYVELLQLLYLIQSWAALYEIVAELPLAP